MATLFTPYGDFVLVLGGLLLAAAVLGELLGGRRPPLVTTVGLMVALLLTALSVPTMWRGAAGRDQDRAGLRTPYSAVRLEKCFFDGGRAWQLRAAVAVSQRIPPGDTYAVDSGNADRACLALNMLPRRLVARSDTPRWTVRLGRADAELRARIRAESSLPPAERTVTAFTRRVFLIEEGR
jgi:hypothetical protein